MGCLLFFYDVKNSHFCCCPNSTGGIFVNAFLHLLTDILLNAHN